MFRQASVVVAPHGAGLTNIVFSRAETTVLEFYSPKYNVDCFQSLGRSLGQTVIRMECMPAGNNPRTTVQEEDIMVPIDPAMEVLRKAIKS